MHGAVSAPDVEMSVHRADDDLELAVAVDVGEHGRGEEAGVETVGLVADRRVGERRIGAHREARTEHARRREDVELPLRRGHHHLEGSVAFEIADGRRAQDGFVHQRAHLPAHETRRAGVEDVEIGRDGPAGELCAGGVEGVNLSGGGGDHDVELPVAVQVGERR